MDATLRRTVFLLCTVAPASGIVTSMVLASGRADVHRSRTIRNSQENQHEAR